MTDRKTVEIECWDCAGTGQVDDTYPDGDRFKTTDCPHCHGRGRITPAEDDE